MTRRLHALETDGRRLLGHPFEWSSSKDIGRVLFDELRLGEGHEATMRIQRKPTKSRRQPVCAWETSTVALRKLARLHPLPEMIIEHRKISANLRFAAKSGSNGVRHGAQRLALGSAPVTAVAAARVTAPDDDEGGEDEDECGEDGPAGRAASITGAGLDVFAEVAQRDEHAIVAAAAAASSSLIFSASQATAVGTSHRVLSQSEPSQAWPAAASQLVLPAPALTVTVTVPPPPSPPPPPPPPPPHSAPTTACAVYCTFDQTSTATGRLTTTRPNLQCLPKAWRMVHAATYTSDSLHAELSSALLPPTLPPRTLLRVQRLSDGRWVDAELVAVLEQVVAQPYSAKLPALTLRQVYARQGVLYSDAAAATVRQVRACASSWHAECLRHCMLSASLIAC